MTSVEPELTPLYNHQPPPYPHCDERDFFSPPPVHQRKLLKRYTAVSTTVILLSTVIIALLLALIVLASLLTESLRTCEDPAQDALQRQLKSMGLYWRDVQPIGQCLGVGRRVYEGRLGNLLPSVNAVAACKATPMTFKGRVYNSPMECEERGEGVAYGRWTVENDPVCSPYWDFPKDKGCIGSKSGIRRFEAHLLNIRPEDDSEMICYAMPVQLLGQTLKRPLACPDWGLHGRWGIWDVQDRSCQ